MADWSQRVGRATLVCSVTGKAIAPGEVFFSLLESSPEGVFVRADLCSEAWDAARAENAVSWWRRKSSLSTGKEKRRVDLASLERALEGFLETQQRAQRCLAWVLGLWLVRSKRWREAAAGLGYLELENKARTKRLRVPDPNMNENEYASVAEGLKELLEMATDTVTTDTEEGSAEEPQTPPEPAEPQP